MTTLASLAHYEIWVGWRQETKDGRPTKIPYDPRTGQKAETDNAATWATLAEAQWWAGSQHADGYGVVLNPIKGVGVLCGIDLDSCRDPNTSETTPWAQAVIDRFATYSEVSPSGTGVKLFFTVDAATAVDMLFDGKTGRLFKRRGGIHPPAIEIYRAHRYFAVTEDSCGPTDDLRAVNLADLEWLIRDYGPKFVGEGPKPKSQPHDDSRSAKAFRAGAALKAGGATYEEMRDALLHHADPEVAAWAQTKGMASPVGAFVRERCQTGAAYTVEVDAVFEAWKTWCEAQGRDHPGTKQTFGRDLKAAAPGVKMTRPRSAEDRIRTYQGLRLKPFAAQSGWKS